MSESSFIEDARKRILTDKVKDYTIKGDESVCDLLTYFEQAHGFMASHLSKAARILSDMFLDKDVFKILSFTGNLVATGLRGVLAQLLREGYFNAVITTCGMIDHDIARGTGGVYYKGDWGFDDAFLKAVEIHRLGNILIPVENYGLTVERFSRRLFEELVKERRRWSGYELLWEAGRRINDENSILRVAYEAKTPVFVPGFYDGAFGSQIVFNQSTIGLEVDLLEDEKKLAELVFSSQKLGALIVGGGISKHHTIWWAQFREGLDYAIYVTTAVEYDGSLSGAHPREAVSWGKIKPLGKTITVYGDATIILPLIIAGSKCLLKKEKISAGER
ncbi:MAG: deoxyhypusine synthase [Thermosphaera sp.]